MYTYNKKILFSDIDSKSRMTVDSILNSMQDCVNINSESIGKGIEYMHKTKRAWFAIGWNIEIKRYPKMFEDVVVKTWPYSFTQSMGLRNVIITDAAGKDIVCADSIWTLVDTESGMPVRIEQADYEGYELEEKYPMNTLGRKIRLPKNNGENVFTNIRIHEVVKSDLDFNGHMTNGKYIQYANDVLPLDSHISNIRVEYKTQSRFGEKILVNMYHDEEKSCYLIRFTGCEDEKIKAIVEFIVD